MASINSITGSLSSTSSLRGYGGLASGLDRDELIEQLTYATRSKIEAQKQKSDKIGWQQTVLRDIIDKGYNFVNTYASYGSSSNLTSNQLFSRSQVSVEGTYSSYVSVSGTATSSDLFSIAGVKQLASDAKVSGSAISTNELVFGSVDFNKTTTENLVADQEISFKYGDTTYYAKIEADADLDFSDPEDLAKALNKAFENTEVTIDQNGNTKKLSDMLTAETYTDSDGMTKLSLVSKGGGGNTFEITGGTGDVLEKLGFVGEGESFASVSLATAGTELKAENEANAVKETTMTEMLAGKTLTFNYNGTSGTVTLGSNITSVEELQTELQSGLNSAFGKGRIEVGVNDDGSLTFQTRNLTTGGKDTTSTFSISSASSGLLGTGGIFGVSAGTSNRVNLSSKVSESGLAGAQGMASGEPLDLTINGVKIEGLTSDSTVQEVIDAINNSDADVTISYSASSDRFVIASNQKGASGSIEMEGNFAKALFGEAAGTTDEAGNFKISTQGKDAIIMVQYAGDDEPTEVYRDSNSFTMDGLTVNLKKTFGYDADGNRLDDTEAVTFSSSVDVEKTTSVVKEMIEAFNAIVDQVNSELTTKPDSDYKNPLTASEKEDMSESEIEEYEEKAKTGMFYGDSDLRMFSQDLWNVIPSSDLVALEEIGISISSSYSDNGKLVFDEEKFKAALESDPEKVEELFTRTAGTDADGNAVSSGLMENMKNVMNKYTNTIGTKGVLVQRAGSEHSPLSVLDNTMQTQMDEISDYIDRLLDQLESEEERYISQFTTLETLISQMNTQSSYLSSLTGGY